MKLGLQDYSFVLCIDFLKLLNCDHFDLLPKILSNYCISFIKILNGVQFIIFMNKWSPACHKRHSVSVNRVCEVAFGTDIPNIYDASVFLNFCESSFTIWDGLAVQITVAKINVNAAEKFGNPPDVVARFVYAKCIYTVCSVQFNSFFFIVYT